MTRPITLFTDGSVPTSRGRTRGAAGTSSRPATATCPWERCFRMLNNIGYDGPISVEWEDAGMDRLRGAPEALEFVRSLAFDPPEAAFDAAFATDS
jgi:sugar phosphate isomerase/epimerase